MSSLTQSPEWLKIEQNKKRLEQLTILDLFSQDQNRAHDFSLKFNDLFFDYSKNIIDKQTISDLVDLTNAVGLKESIEAMFRGDKINFTENRSVLHVALRDRSKDPLIIDGRDIKVEIQKVLGRMSEFSDSIRNKSFLGSTGLPIKNIINVGIGGSDLGPLMASFALQDYALHELNIQFVSNIDPNSLFHAIESLNPAETLFIISSKTFTTDETMTNAEGAKQWIVENLGPDSVNRHFVAVSTNLEAVRSFGIDEDKMFEFWDFVGGRYSLCSAIGLSLMISIGQENFYKMLDGFYAVDLHFKNSNLDQNIPVLLALISIFYINFYDVSSEAVIPYNENLKYLPLYLQQLTMESNGKRVDRNGDLLDYNSGSVVWGSQGTNSQHAYFQLLHQGTRVIPVDLIGFISGKFNQRGKYQKKLLANLLAQSRALAFGGPADNQSDFEHMPGNQPNNILLFDELNPYSLGELIAIYEHKTFVEGIIWNINSFDQFGVNLGKEIAKDVYQSIDGGFSEKEFDQSTTELINHIKNSSTQ